MCKKDQNTDVARCHSLVLLTRHCEPLKEGKAVGATGRKPHKEDGLKTGSKAACSKKCQKKQNLVR